MALTFHHGALGGGGYVLDIIISPDGLTRLIRTDVYTPYIWSSAEDKWLPLINSTSVPSDDNILGNTNGIGFGCYAIDVARSNSAIIYAVFYGHSGTTSTVYKSTNRGTTWVKTTLTPMTMSVQDNNRMFGHKMAVHPTDPDIVLVTNNAGDLWRTADGGTNWTEITVPSGEDPCIQFDLNDPTIVIMGWRTGDNRTYRSTDTGATFAQMTGGPDNHRRMTCGTNGKFYMTASGVTGNVWRLVGTTFTNLTMTQNTLQYHAVAVSPVNPDRVTVGFSAGNINTSLDGGDTWGGMYTSAPIRSATGDVTWLAWTNEDSMSSGNIAYDPDDEDLLWFVEGIGVWYTTPPLNNAQPTWHSQTRGNDELIIDDAKWPPGSRPFITSQDRSIFRLDDFTVYPSTHGPGRTVALQHSYGMDYASSDSSFLAIASSGGPGSFYTDDGGDTWTAFASQSPVATAGLSGSMAALTPLNIVWCPSNNGFPYYTTDGGATWTLCTFPGDVPTSGVSGFGYSILLNLKYVAADRVASTFYAINYITGDAYKSTDSGANFTKTADAVFTDIGTNQALLTVPGQSGHLFLAQGKENGTALKRSTDAGATWSTLANTSQSYALGIGAAAPGESYPSLLLFGKANGDTLPGIYLSTDNCATWVLQTNAPAGSIDMIRTIAGNPDTYGEFVIGTSGSGYIYTSNEAEAGNSVGTFFGLQF